MAEKKPCKDCKDKSKEPRVDLSAYQRPPGRSLLADLAYTLPTDDGERYDFALPTISDDGSIEYPKREGDWEPPPPINGYARDPENKWRFIPLWDDCLLRLQGTKRKPNCGCIDVVMICNNPEASQFGSNVKLADCQACPFRRS